jgi:hypothetical protein
VVGKPHEIKGESVFAFVVLRGPRPTGEVSVLVKELRDWVAEQVGAIAKPDDIRFADNLPKTRSGKIMRRLLKSIARGEEITQDVSTLENPAILEQLRGTGAPASSAKAAPKKPAAKPAAKAGKSAPRVKKAKRARAKPAAARRTSARRPVRAKSRKAARAPLRKPARRPPARKR